MKARFFRTTLYANTEVSAYLRQHYVLHWSSERPVPVATIDFGDGRKVTRTITGNSIHYVLDAEGRLALVLSKNPVDVTSPTTPTLTDELAVELIKNLETSIALDTARNEYALHAVLHRWLREYPTVSFEDFNREVYARLFLTPATDPWPGLVPALTWTALPNDGIELKRR